MLCSKCGQNLDNNAKFCMNCGNKIVSNQPSYNNLYSKPQVNNFNPLTSYNQQNYNIQSNNFNQRPGYNQQNYNGQSNNFNQMTSYNQQNYNMQSNNFNQRPAYNQQSNNYMGQSNGMTNPNYKSFNQAGYINQMNNGNIGFNNNSYVKKKNNNLMYTCLGIISVTLIVVVTLIIVYNKDSVYFSKEKEEDYISYENNNDSSTGKTVVDPDRVYYMTINSEKSAYSKISEDSVSQKSTCPKEIVEIENRIVKNYNITAVNLCEMDVGYAKEVEEVIKRIYVEYPSARGYLTNISLINAPDNQSYIAAFRSFYYFIMPSNGGYPIISKNSILLNTEYFLNSDYMVSSIDSAVRRGHFPPNANRTSAVAHEFGHYLSFICAMKKHNVKSVLFINADNYNALAELSNDWVKGKNSQDIINTAYKNYQKKYNDYKTSLIEFRSSISAYAVARDEAGNYIYDETIAEAFHDYYLNGNNAKPASKEIVAELKRRLS